MFVEHKEFGEVIESPAKTLKLSEAIRMGARIRPQCMGYWYKDGRSCALGAAYEAWRGHIDEHNISLPGEALAMLEAFPAIRDLHVAISVKNDDGQTREQIADWLEAQGY